MRRKALLVGVQPEVGTKGPWIRLNGTRGWVVEDPSGMVDHINLHVEEFSGRLRSQRMVPTTQLSPDVVRVRAEVIKPIELDGIFVLGLAELEG